ncbi:amidase [Paraburkholderia fungorum]|uniref:amidase n=1 Tax=Paraburkholderia fungorum TaxID=134537 RepID=UPI000DB3250D|nr:amidase [Paraburkholderia fungorum]PZR51089.1 MAG: amidase [Paraburkholderia fungorum]QLD51890.1 amidase [Paraburkholderia fungorum]
MNHSSPSPTIREIRDAIRAGTRTIDQTVQQAFDAAQRLQPELQAFIHLPAAPVINRAAPHAPLAGVPVGVKDLIDTADMPTAYGSPAYEGRRPDKDAWVVARLREAGATVLGKTVTTEFAWRQPGATTNPWNSNHTPGGSSSGSAAAVAAGIVPLALGTQTFGSVIRPAAYCGVVGVKPSYGTIARTGVLPLSGSLDHLGVFTTNVADAVHVLSILAGSDADDPHPSHNGRQRKDPGDAAKRPPRIGVLREQIGGAIDKAQQHVLNQLALRLRADGAEIVGADVPAELFNAARHASILVAVEAALVHGELVDRSPDLVSAPIKALVAEGRALPATGYAKAKALQVQMALRFDRWLTEEAGLDALLVAPASGEAPRGLDYTGDAAFCAPWTFLGVPAVTLPVNFGPAGLPLGVQLVGAGQHDAALLSLAEWVEGRTGWNIAVASR